MRILELLHEYPDPADFKSMDIMDSIQKQSYGKMHSQEGAPGPKIATRSGMDVIYWCVENDCHEILHTLFAKWGVTVDEAILRRACMSVQGRTIGSPRTMRLFLENLLKESETDGVEVFPEESEITAVREKLRNAKGSKNWFRNTRQHDLLLKVLESSGIKIRTRLR